MARQLVVKAAQERFESGRHHDTEPCDSAYLERLMLSCE